MRKKATKSVWLYVDGERQFDVVLWALERDLLLPDAKAKLAEECKGQNFEFKIE